MTHRHRSPNLGTSPGLHSRTLSGPGHAPANGTRHRSYVNPHHSASSATYARGYAARSTQLVSDLKKLSRTLHRKVKSAGNPKDVHRPHHAGGKPGGTAPPVAGSAAASPPRPFPGEGPYEDRLSKWTVVTNAVVDSFEKISMLYEKGEPTFSAARWFLQDFRFEGAERKLEPFLAKAFKLLQEVKRTELELAHAAAELEAVRKMGSKLLPNVRSHFEIKQFLTEFEAEGAAADFTNLALRNPKALAAAKFLDAHRRGLEVLHSIGVHLDRLQVVCDLMAIIEASRHNNTNLMVFKSGDLIFDAAALFVPPLILVKCIAQPYLDWTQEQIDKHPDVDAIVRAPEHRTEFTGKSMDQIVKEHSDGVVSIKWN